MKTTLSWTTPTTKTDGTMLPLTDIEKVTVFKNGKPYKDVPVIAGKNEFVDEDVTGRDLYNVGTTTKDGFLSPGSNTVVVNTVKAARVIDLKAVLDSTPGPAKAPTPPPPIK